MISYLDFEKPVAALQARIDELRETADDGALNIDAEIEKLQQRSTTMLAELYGKLTPWQKTQVARHAERPHFRDFVSGMCSDFMPLAGDRAFADDKAIQGGFATIEGRKVMLIGHEKGNDTASRVKHNFGMGMPDGYRKAVRLMELAGRFGLPVVTLVDTSGAFPGVQAEERGQAEAIARATEACLALGVQVVAAANLRGLQDTRVPMLVALFGYWVVGFGTAIALGFRTALAGVGIWMGLAAGLLVVSILLTWRWSARERIGLARAR